MADPATNTPPVVDELLTHDEVRQLIRSASNRAPTGIRNRALIAALYRAGLRPGEALALKVQDADLDAGTVRIPARKSGNGRTVGLDGQTIELVRRWVTRREALGLGREGTLVPELQQFPQSVSSTARSRWSNLAWR